MLTARGIRKSFGPHEVLRGVDWAVPPGSRWGLVGLNGSGKTTLLEILCGVQAADAGSVERPGRTSVAWLPQEGGTLTSGTLLEVVLGPFTGISAMESEMRRLEDALASGSNRAGDGGAHESGPRPAVPSIEISAAGARAHGAGDPPEGGSRQESGPARDPALLARRLGELQHRFEAAGGFRLESEAKIILGGLGFAPGDHRRPITEFSGGYRTRALLSSLLLQRPDYLFLDEPTNHLDLEGIQWLEEYLQGLPSAVVSVSHDRLFLNRTVASIAEIEGGTLRVYRGDYDAYRAEKSARRDREEAAAAREGRRVEQVERFIERFRYKATKARQVQERIKMLEKMERTEVTGAEVEWGFRLRVPSRPPQVVLEIDGVSKAFGLRQVLRGASLLLQRGERVALVGPNGCGKSTLLRVAAGDLDPDEGGARTGHRVTVRFVAQHLLEVLTEGRTLLDELQALAPGARQGELRSLLGVFQFSGDAAFKEVTALSGGEKSRLALARLALQPAHLLLLDEPTNHLDLAAREALEEAILSYEGSVVFASHDRYFINRVATKVAGFHEGRLVVVEGGYDDYLRFLKEKAAPGALSGEEAEREAIRRRRKDERREEAEARNERSRRLGKMRSQVEAFEREIARREARLAELRSALADGGTYRQPGLAESLGREEKSVAAELEGLVGRWEEASRLLHEAEAGS